MDRYTRNRMMHKMLYRIMKVRLDINRGWDEVDRSMVRVYLRLQNIAWN